MSSFKPGKIERVAGPVIVAGDMLGAQMYEVVRVGDQGLIGEIIKIEQDRATVQVYEETAGIRPGEKVERSGKPLSVEFGPGITGQIYDGIQRPLTILFEKTGPFIRRGLTLPPIDKGKKWHFVPTLKAQHRDHPRRLRDRKNHGATAARKMGRRIRHRLRGMR